MMTDPKEEMAPGPTQMQTDQAAFVDQEDNLAILINNLVTYCTLSQGQEATGETLADLKNGLRQQLNELWFEERLKKFAQQPEAPPSQSTKKLFELEQIIRSLNELKNSASSEEKYIDFERQLGRYVGDLEDVIESQDVGEFLDKLDIYAGEEASVDKSVHESEIDIPESHNFRQLINTRIDYGTAVFSYVRPDSHMYYVAQAARAYEDIAPFKIKHIAQSMADSPAINRRSYFEEGIDPLKAILPCCLPGTNKLAYYCLVDICQALTMGKEFYQERQLSNQWKFSESTRIVLTKAGKIFAINCRTTEGKIDPYLYEIGDSKASNRGPVPAPKRDAALLYLNGHIYVIGGRGEGEKCSKKSYKYNIKSKKWASVCESNVPLRKATVCSINDRYILKMGGLNEFDYINKIIEMYDTATDRWSVVRASPRNILQEIEILEDSQAMQINDDQVYVFGGKNANKFSTDTGFVLLIAEIREKKRGAARVSGEFWNVSVGKRNLLSFMGAVGSTAPILHHNCIYALRVPQ